MSGTIPLTQRFLFYFGLIVLAIICYTLGATTPLVGLIFVGMAAEIFFWLGLIGLFQKRRARKRGNNGPSAA